VPLKMRVGGWEKLASVRKSSTRKTVAPPWEGRRSQGRRKGARLQSGDFPETRKRTFPREALSEGRKKTVLEGGKVFRSGTSSGKNKRSFGRERDSSRVLSGQGGEKPLEKGKGSNWSA